MSSNDEIVWHQQSPEKDTNRVPTSGAAATSNSKQPSTTESVTVSHESLATSSLLHRQGQLASILIKRRKSIKTEKAQLRFQECKLSVSSAAFSASTVDCKEDRSISDGVHDVDCISDPAATQAIEQTSQKTSVDTPIDASDHLNRLHSMTERGPALHTLPVGAPPSSPSLVNATELDLSTDSELLRMLDIFETQIQQATHPSNGTNTGMSAAGTVCPTEPPLQRESNVEPQLPVHQHNAVEYDLNDSWLFADVAAQQLLEQIEEQYAQHATTPSPAGSIATQDVHAWARIAADVPEAEKIARIGSFGMLSTGSSPFTTCSSGNGVQTRHSKHASSIGSTPVFLRCLLTAVSPVLSARTLLETANAGPAVVLACSYISLSGSTACVYVVAMSDWHHTVSTLRPGAILHIVACKHGVAITTDGVGSVSTVDKRLVSLGCSSSLRLKLPFNNLLDVVCVDHDRNAIIVHPDTLLAPTKITASFTCLRRVVLQEVLGDLSAAEAVHEASSAALMGQLKHSLVETALHVASGSDAGSSILAQWRQASKSTSDDSIPAELSYVCPSPPLFTSLLRSYARMLVARIGTLTELSECNMSDSAALQQLNECIPAIVDWTFSFVAAARGRGVHDLLALAKVETDNPPLFIDSPVESYEVNSLRARFHHPAPFVVTDVVGTEDAVTSPIWGLKGFVDATVDLALVPPDHIPTQTGTTASHADTIGVGVGVRRSPLRYGTAADRTAQRRIIQHYPTGLDALPRVRAPFELKTGKRPTSGIAMDHRAQLAIYSLLIQERYATANAKSYTSSGNQPRLTRSASAPSARLQWRHTWPNVEMQLGASGGSDTSTGAIILYLNPPNETPAPDVKDRNHFTTVVSIRWDEQRALLEGRNRLAAALHEARLSFANSAAIRTTSTASDVNHGGHPVAARGVITAPLELPRLQQEARLCKSCFMRVSCTAVYVCGELPTITASAEASGSSRVPLIEEITMEGGLRDMYEAATRQMSRTEASERRKAYFSRWMRIIQCEAAASSSSRQARSISAAPSTDVEDLAAPRPSNSTANVLAMTPSLVGAVPFWVASNNSRKISFRQMVLIQQRRATVPVRHVGKELKGTLLSSKWTSKEHGGLQQRSMTEFLTRADIDAVVHDVNDCDAEESSESSQSDDIADVFEDVMYDYIFVPLTVYLLELFAMRLDEDATYSLTALQGLLHPELGAVLAGMQSSEGETFTMASLRAVCMEKSPLRFAFQDRQQLIVSVDKLHGPFSIFRGAMVTKLPDMIVVRGHRDMLAAFPQGFANMHTSSELGQYTLPLLWRLDTQEYTTSTSVQMSSLIKLLFGPTPHWQTIVDTTSASDCSVVDEYQSEFDAFLATIDLTAFDPPGQNTTTKDTLLGAGDVHRQKLIIDMAAPQVDESFDVEGVLCKVGMLECFKGLNADQQAAVSAVLRAKDYACILGLPGTGKTSTMAFMVGVLVALGLRVLITSHTHAAVDTLLLKVLELNIPVLRLGQQSSVHPSVRQHTVERKVADGHVTSVKALSALYSGAIVVGSTCLALDSYPLLREREFDVVLVDEAGQIPEPICIAPLLLGRRFVLVGDHAQLPPLVLSAAALEAGLGVSLLKRLCDAHPRAVVPLTLQYRMNAEIQRIANRTTYNGMLACANESVATQRLDLPRFCDIRSRLPDWMAATMDPHNPVVFVDTDDYNAECEVSAGNGAMHMRATGTASDAESQGLYNLVECAVVRAVTHQLLAAGLSGENIGIMSPYNVQVRLLRSEVQGKKESMYESVEIDTVDRFQGRDKTVIIVSFVRSNTALVVGNLLKQLPRLTVAFTRPKAKLILVGSRGTLVGGNEVFQHVMECSRVVKLTPMYEFLPA